MIAGMAQRLGRNSFAVDPVESFEGLRICFLLVGAAALLRPDSSRARAKSIGHYILGGALGLRRQWYYDW